MNWIDFKDLPTDGSAFSSLFLDYVSDFGKVKKYFSGNFRDANDWKATLDLVSKRSLSRSEVARILTTQNRDFHCGVKTLANIDALLNDNAVAVVTGQQVGLFTGPLYTIYKTITVLKLVDQLRELHPEYQFIPVFWLEGEDHDVEEVDSGSLVNKSNDLFKLKYPVAEPGENVGPIGQLQFTDSIADVFREAEEGLTESEFKGKVLELFRVAYQPGMTFNRAFVHLMNDLLEDSGLVFLDPHDPEFKKLLAPVFRTELEQTPKLCRLIIDQSAAVEKQYHAQVKPRPVNLFFFHNKGRYLIEPKGEGFGLKGTRKQFTRDELLGLVQDRPELFSPNVVLRPICQDVLLPTVAYVGGPGEISYFAQLKPLYAEFSIPEPIIYPRASISLVEEKVEKVLSRYNLELTEFFRDAEFVKEKVAEQVSDVKLEELFGGTDAAVHEALQSLGRGLSKIDKTLLGALETGTKKIDFQIETLRNKAIAAQKRQSEAALRQIEKASYHVFPYSNFQERELNILHFLNKYGLEFLRWLRGEMVIDKFKHQIIRL